MSVSSVYVKLVYDSGLLITSDSFSSEHWPLRYHLFALDGLKLVEQNFIRWVGKLIDALFYFADQNLINKFHPTRMLTTDFGNPSLDLSMIKNDDKWLKTTIA